MFLAASGSLMTRAAGEPCVAATWPLTMKPWWSPWTTVVSLKAMTDAMNLDGPLEQTECLEDENFDLGQINLLGYLGRIRTQNGRFGVLDVPLERANVWNLRIRLQPEQPGPDDSDGRFDSY